MSSESFVAKTNVSRETLARLESYAETLRKWNRAINLVAPSSLNALWTRHFLDSAQLLDFAPTAAKTWIDIGSGAGFPGLVIAIMRPNFDVTLVESDRRKCVFLRETARATGTDLTVLESRIEDVEQTADIVSARALAPVSKLLEWSYSLRAPGGVALFLKGENVENELTEANHLWHTEFEQHRSRTDPRGSILAVTEFHRRTVA